MRILMLHGYAQSGETFRRKLTRLEEKIRKHHPDTSFVYPDGPINLDADDKTFNESWSSNPMELCDRPEQRAWFHLPLVVEPANGLHNSLEYMAGILASHGPFDGVIAFSQGTVIAALMASLLHGPARRVRFEKASHGRVMRYPESFLAVKHPPLKFGLFYASRIFDGDYYDWLYDEPDPTTSFCLFFGQWDSMVEPEDQDAVLRKLGADERLRKHYHCGAHFVPCDSANVGIAADFIAERMASDSIGLLPGCKQQ